MARVSIVEWIIKKLKRCIAIVEDGDTASQAIASGKYVIWKGNACQASSAISQGDTLSSSNLTALSDGIGNELNSKFTNYTDVTGTTDSTGNITVSDVDINKVIKAIPIRNATGYYQSFYVCVLGGNISATTLLLHCIDSSGSPVQNQNVNIRLYHS